MRIAVGRVTSFEPLSRFHLGLKDLSEGLLQWRVFVMLALLEVRQRYRRSSIGQFWITLSMAAQILGIGIVFSVILGQSIASYLPYLGAGIVLWAFVVGIVNEAATAFISSELYLKSYPGPRSMVVYRTIVRNWVFLLHNMVICVILIVIFSVPVGVSAFLFFPALMLVSINGVWIGLLLGALAARFRDLPLIVTNVMQLAFFLTPIMYRPQQVSEKLWVVSHLNPFASWIQIMRAPLLGQEADPYHWFFSISTAILGFAIAIPFFARFRERIVYWL